MSGKENKPDEGFETSPERRGTSFDIGSQQAGTVGNVGGDLTVGKASVTGSAKVLREAIAALAREVARVDLPQATRSGVDEHLAAAAAEAESMMPDRPKIARHLKQVASLLTGANRLQTADGRLIEAFRRTAELLGATGGPLLATLSVA